METLQQILAEANITERDIEWAAWRVQQGTATQEDWALLFAAASQQIVNFKTIGIENELHPENE
jgi:hypothetical protein